MYSTVTTAILRGIDSVLVQVESDISDGMPIFEMVGFLSAEVKEAKERVRTALRNCNQQLPVKRITVNISPANIRKTGSGFDLPIAISVLAAMGRVEESVLKDVLMIGEMGLNGKIHSVNGVLPIVLAAKEKGIRQCIVPKKNLEEAMLVGGISSIGVEHLTEVIHFLNTGEYIYEEDKRQPAENKTTEYTYDFSMLNGQKLLKRACEVAVSGMHNLLMVGPPGAGKTMVAKCIPSILPPMNEAEQMELSKIYSVCGLFEQRRQLMDQRPFRSPHHTISIRGLTGGGAIPKPGEISLANKGVLFLDELPEFQKSTLEILRQPLEEKTIQIARVNGTFQFPADFVLVAAMNPCNCGYYPDLNRCHCTSASIKRYMGKISQPLLDRMDLCVEVPQVQYRDLVSKEDNECSTDIRQRVVRTHEIQRNRFQGDDNQFNSQMTMEQLQKYCCLGEKEKKYMEQTYEKLQLTARTYHKLLRVARTIADMRKEEQIQMIHLQEAICYRGLDPKYWEACI